MSSPAHRKRVLFVDDDHSFLEMLENLFGLWAKGTWEILIAPSTGKALTILQERPVDLIVIDLHMPVMDGFQFLKLVHRKYPNLPKAILTALVEPASRDMCLANGAEMVLEKPSAIDQMESVFSTLNELVELQAQDGFRGVLRRVGLQEVIQLECLGNKSSILEITTQGTKGRIFIRDGAIIHAHIGQKKGEEAFNRLLAFDTGEFTLKPFTEPPEETIQGQWEMLVMEAARLRDEVIREVENIPAEPSTEPESSPAPVPEAIPARKPLPAKDVRTLLPQPTIDEIVICTSQGESLFEWQSADSDQRVELARMLQRCGDELSRKLNFGRCDRVQSVGGVGRLLFQIQKDCTVFVRSSNVAPELLSSNAPRVKAC